MWLTTSSISMGRATTARRVRPRPASASSRKRRKPPASTASTSASTPSVSASAASALRTVRALRAGRADAALVDALEWLGDAVLGELVGRCLLSQFRAAPLAARVFRSLRLAAVANRNLARAFDRLGYAQLRPRGPAAALRLKDKADAVEAVVGELSLRPGRADELRTHLDALVATVLRAHFDELSRRVRGRPDAPLSAHLNPFACLPLESLGTDAALGGLVVVESVPDVDELLDADLADADLADEPQLAVGGCHHAFPDAADDAEDESVGPSFSDTAVHDRVRIAMRSLRRPDHVLRASADVFEIFKVYGMAVLAERVSLALAAPQLTRALRSNSSDISTSPAELTRTRQKVLSVANLAACATELGVVSPLLVGDDAGQDEDRLRANTIRAFVGFHSATASSSIGAFDSNALVNGICRHLHALSGCLVDNADFKLPAREPLAALMHSAGEARAFMQSKECGDLHSPGERPPGKPSLLLRRCDSDTTDDLFDILARDLEKEKARKMEALIVVRAKSKRVKASATPARQPLATLDRFLHRRFLFCLEEIIVLFAQRHTEECRAKMALFANDLEPCADPVAFRKWGVSTSTLTFAMRDSFYRLLLHDLSHFHALVSTSKDTRDGTRVTMLRLPLHYSWTKLAGNRLTDEAKATS